MGMNGDEGERMEMNWNEWGWMGMNGDEWERIGMNRDEWG